MANIQLMVLSVIALMVTPSLSQTEELEEPTMPYKSAADIFQPSKLTHMMDTAQPTFTNMMPTVVANGESYTVKGTSGMNEDEGQDQSQGSEGQGEGRKEKCGKIFRELKKKFSGDDLTNSEEFQALSEKCQKKIKRKLSQKGGQGGHKEKCGKIFRELKKKVSTDDLTSSEEFKALSERCQRKIKRKLRRQGGGGGKGGHRGKCRQKFKELKKQFSGDDLTNSDEFKALSEHCQKKIKRKLNQGGDGGKGGHMGKCRKSFKELKKQYSGDDLTNSEEFKVLPEKCQKKITKKLSRQGGGGGRGGRGGGGRQGGQGAQASGDQDGQDYSGQGGQDGQGSGGQDYMYKP